MSIELALVKIGKLCMAREKYLKQCYIIFVFCGNSQNNKNESIA